MQRYCVPVTTTYMQVWQKRRKNLTGKPLPLQEKPLDYFLCINSPKAWRIFQ